MLFPSSCFQVVLLRPCVHLKCPLSTRMTYVSLFHRYSAKITQNIQHSLLVPSATWPVPAIFRSSFCFHLSSLEHLLWDKQPTFRYFVHSRQKSLKKYPTQIFITLSSCRDSTKSWTTAITTSKGRPTSLISPLLDESHPKNPTEVVLSSESLLLLLIRHLEGQLAVLLDLSTPISYFIPKAFVLQNFS